ncbi:hypothetical protein AAC387_Pa04g2217 [Persea americana]
MVVGKRCFNGDDDREARRLRKALSRFFYLVGVFVVYDALPFFKWFDFQGHRGAMKATSRECDSLLAKWLDKHRIRRSSGEEEGRKEDFMDVMLLIIEDGQISGYDHDTIIKATRLSMILGGTDTTSIILARAIALVLTNPQALKKAQEELDIQVGN